MTPHASLWFVDTNVLLYRYDSVNTSKQMAAQDWLETLGARRAARLSWQVLNEFYDNATRKGGVSRASAETLGCRWLLTEDFQEGRHYGSVEVVNPFTAAPKAFLET